MQNILIATVVVILVLGGGYYWYTSQGVEDAMMEDDSMMESGSAENEDQMMDDGSMMDDGAMMEEVVEFTVEGKNFALAPSSLAVKKGDTVRITFKNTGGVHDFVIDEFNVKTKQIEGGQEEVVEFVADKTGSFEFYCSVGQHRAMGMKGTLLVTE